MENDCGATFESSNGRRRRSLHHVVKRQTITAANAALQETVTCADSVSSLFGRLADSLCSGSVASSNCNCWNGATTGRLVKSYITSLTIYRLNEAPPS